MSRPKHVAIIPVSKYLLSKLLSLPSQIHVVSCQDSQVYPDVTMIKIEGDELKPVAEGEQIPTVELTHASHVKDKERVTVTEFIEYKDGTSLVFNQEPA